MGFGVLPRKQVECIVTPLLWSTKNPLRGSTGRSHPGQFLAVVSDITNPFPWEWMVPTECRPLGRVARRPVWSCLSKREVSGNRRGCAGGVASVIDRAGERVGEFAAAGDPELVVNVAEVA